MPDLASIYADLHRILEPYAVILDAKRNDESELYVDTRHLQKNKKPLFFGAVQTKKSYVAFHLMPLYLQPALLASVKLKAASMMQMETDFTEAQTQMIAAAY